MKTAKFIHITKPSWNKVRVDSKGTLCGRMANLMARTSTIDGATCPRCVAEALSREVPAVQES